ncbi:unnamed protein product [Vitrella brassicaformis CCMP3155]|uniref:Uncharacterized protein n=1 Tax=Vitrella brassicaformis (strain CCMP3155) TaxID=1169540 RepID=A0A0G4GSV8_VITBC|nr:unnamed protein product [Vitrella brassicaformis CCMP3155]|eukprot:CEM33766.1 unnamed protein product [Vitrella brassicaformis CCMP3155]
MEAAGERDGGGAGSGSSATRLPGSATHAANNQAVSDRDLLHRMRAGLDLMRDLADTLQTQCVDLSATRDALSGRLSEGLMRIESQVDDMRRIIDSSQVGAGEANLRRADRTAWRYAYVPILDATALTHPLTPAECADGEGDSLPSSFCLADRSRRPSRGRPAPRAAHQALGSGRRSRSTHGSIDRISVTDGGRYKGRREHRITVVIKALSSNG